MTHAGYKTSQLIIICFGKLESFLRFIGIISSRQTWNVRHCNAMFCNCVHNLRLFIFAVDVTRAGTSIKIIVKR